ncbi:hypothetical protein ACS25B_15600 [Dickeya dadantii subsp. dieffenbachiae]
MTRIFNGITSVNPASVSHFPHSMAIIIGWPMQKPSNPYSLRMNCGYSTSPA